MQIKHKRLFLKRNTLEELVAMKFEKGKVRMNDDKMKFRVDVKRSLKMEVGT